MKFNFQSYHFKTWLSFTTFAIAILGLLWFLIGAFLDPYYRNIKINSMKNIVANISVVIEPNSTDFAFELSKIARDRNICFYLVSEKGQKTFFDGMGVNCYISASSFNEEPFLVDEFIDEIKNSNNYEVEQFVTNQRFSNQMMIYGTKISQHLGGYFLIINSGIEPIDYGSFIIKEMYGILTFIVLIIATIASFMISSNMSKPVIKMTESARKLATGDYEVNFEVEKNKYQEIKELGTTLNYATQELSKLESLRRDLIANVSHDIKTPLTMIKAYAEMILDLSGSNKAKRIEHLKVIINEANHLDVLVTDMLELSQLSSGSYTLNLEKVDLYQIAQEIIAVFKGMSELAECEIALVGEKETFVLVDKVKIGQVIYNFISNAVKHLGDDQKISVEIKPEVGDEVSLIVTDHGPGIAKDQLPYIWDRYYKIDKNYQRSKQGSGLGLAIAKGILEAHQADYGVNSVVDEGSSFYFKLKQTKNE